MNLGQARSKSPTSAVLVDAFKAAGAAAAANFQTNGTVIFPTGDVENLIARVRPLLSAATGYTDAVMVRNGTWVAELGRRLDAALPSGEVALFDSPVAPSLDRPWLDTEGGVTILEFDRLHAVTSWAGTGTGSSSSNPMLTLMIGVPVTCRGVPTMIRLATRLSR